MRKLIKLLLIVVVVSFLFGVIFLYQTLNPTLNNIQISEENKEGTYVSPDGEKRITVYFNGGLIFHTDLSYVGLLENYTTKSKKNIFLVSPNIKEVRWISNEMIVVNGIEIHIDDTYDFRKE
ncbi:DUF5412 family protein [Psychrobacillus sp. FJAT-51614]|uniref:DUF5412 family protein n=1 Tax=Psychrobacillus mangrovi TaxID=3117745 RepID=A0ABU8F9C3_9BACI